MGSSHATALWAGALALVATAGCGADTSPSTSPSFDDVAADHVQFDLREVKLSPLAGADTTADLASQRGVVINFWQPGCAPCADESPILQQLVADGFTVIGVDISGGTPSTARAFASQQKWTFPQYQNPAGSAGSADLST